MRIDSCRRPILACFPVLAVLCMALALSACSQGAHVAADACAEGKGYLPLPEGLVLPVPHHIRSDEYYLSKTKTFRRKVVFEILSGGVDSSIEAVESLMRAAGYTVDGEPKGGKKSTALKFKKKKHPTLTIEFKLNVGKKAANPLATHVIIFKWKVADSVGEWKERAAASAVEG